MTTLKRFLPLALVALVGATALVLTVGRATAKGDDPSGPAPSWALKGLDGREVKSSDFGGKVVVLNFWATWCPPCRAEIPDFVEKQKKHEQAGLVFVGVSLDEGGTENVKAFVEKQGINYPIVMGTPEVVEAFGGIEGIPTTFLIDRKGNIREKIVGQERSEVLEKKLQQLLEEKGSQG